MANPAVAGFSYTPGSGTAGSFTIDPTVAAFSGLGSGGSVDVLVSFTVTDPDLGADTGTLSYTVVGAAGPYDEVAFDHRGPEVPAPRCAERVVDPGAAEALVALVGSTTLTSAMAGFDLAALEVPAVAAGRGVALAIAIDDSSATSTVRDGSVATASATGASTATAYAGAASSALATAAAESTSGAVARDDSIAVSGSTGESDALSFAQQSSLAGADAVGASSSIASADGDSVASAQSDGASTASGAASDGSAVEATSDTSSVASAEGAGSSSSTASAFESSAASSSADGDSSATSFAHTGGSADATSADGSLANSVAIDTASSTTVASDASDALSLAQDLSNSTALAERTSSASAGSDADSLARSIAKDGSTSVSDAATSSSVLSQASLSSVSLAEADTGADATAGVCRDRVAWAVGEEGSTTSAQVPQDVTWPELTDEAPDTAGIRLPESLATPSGVVTYLPFDVVGAGGAIDEVVLRGFPAGTTLSAGTPTGSNEWSFAGVPPSDLTFTLPTGWTGAFLLDVAVNTGGDDVAFAVAPTEVVVGGDTTRRGDGQAIEEVTTAATVRKAQLADRAQAAITEVLESGAPAPTGASGASAPGEATSNLFTCGPEADPVDLPVEVARYVPITPCRVVDTRRPGAGGAFGNREIRDYVVRGTGGAFAQQGGTAGGCGIPDEALGVEASITAVDPADSGFFRTWPSGESMPNATFMNFARNQDTTNTGAITFGDESTDIRARNFGGSAQYVIDVQGYYVLPGALAPAVGSDAVEANGGAFPAGAAYVPLTPCRVVDTRQPGAGGQFADREIRDYQVAGTGGGFAAQGGNAGGCGIPDGAVGVEASITAVDPADSGFFRAWPSGQSMPNATFMNFARGEDITNTGSVTLATTEGNDHLRVRNFGGSAQYVIDVQGYYVIPETMDPEDLAGVELTGYVPMTPCRAVDTRQPGAGGRFANREIRDYLIAGTGSAFAGQGGKAGGCGVPDGALGVEASITAVDPADSGFFRAWPSGQSMPNATFMNFARGEDLTNTGSLTIATAGPDDLRARNFGGTAQYVIDLQGYYLPLPPSS
ncbi:MAG: hypothetical protein R2711_12960 [Acidimicrobiales bacterium]